MPADEPNRHRAWIPLLDGTERLGVLGLSLPDGVEGLSEFIEHEASAGQTAPETLRRLSHAIVGSDRATLRDDGTTLLAEWNRGGERAVVPKTVI